MAQRATSTPLDGDFPDTIASEDELASTATLDLINGAVSSRSITVDASGITASKIYVKIYDSVTVTPASDATCSPPPPRDKYSIKQTPR